MVFFEEREIYLGLKDHECVVPSTLSTFTLTRVLPFTPATFTLTYTCIAFIHLATSKHCLFSFISSHLFTHQSFVLAHLQCLVMMSSLPSFGMGHPPAMSQTQADKLPEFDKAAIPNIKKLSTAGDLYVWGTCILLSLGKRRLTDLISTMIRPDVDHPEYDNWAKWSRSVSNWLIENVEDRFTAQLKAIQPALEFADTTWQEIQLLQIARTIEEARMAGQLFRLWNMRTHQFRGIDYYVEALHEQVIRCETLIFGFNYVSTAKIMLYEMEADMPVLAKFIRVQVDNDNTGPNQMTYIEFKGIVRGVIGAVQKGDARVSQ